MDDLISKRAAIDAVIEWYGCEPNDLEYFEKIIEKKPSTEPERKTGRWLIREGISDAQCSECKMYFRDAYDMDNSDAFCRHCGAKMEGLKVVKHG